MKNSFPEANSHMPIYIDLVSYNFLQSLCKNSTKALYEIK